MNAKPDRLDCELCTQPGGHLVHRTDEWRVVRVADAAFPAFYRLVWNRHASEFTDLDAGARQRCMEAVAAVEQTLRTTLLPTKINLASLGNMVAHLHWHVIARFDWDSHFPQPVWGSAQRSVEPSPETRLSLTLDALDAQVGQALAALSAGRD